MSVLDELLAFIDPDEVPPDVQQLLREVGPALARGDYLSEIAERNGHEREWTSKRVTEIRRAFLDQAKDHLDEMSPGLRERVLLELEQLPPPRVRSLL